MARFDFAKCRRLVPAARQRASANPIQDAVEDLLVIPPVAVVLVIIISAAIMHCARRSLGLVEAPQHEVVRGAAGLRGTEAGGNTIAEIGVSGAPGGNLDEDCACAAIGPAESAGSTPASIAASRPMRRA
jgi:hypothetical protein